MISMGVSLLKGPSEAPGGQISCGAVAGVLCSTRHLFGKMEKKWTHLREVPPVKFMGALSH